MFDESLISTLFFLLVGWRLYGKFDGLFNIHANDEH